MKSRSGFSLIELLIVISVIAILTTMSVVVLQGVLNQAREDATAMTVTKVGELLEERIAAFDRAATGAVLADEGDQLERDVKRFFGLPNNSVQPRVLRQRVAELIARKRLFRTFFPQRFAEMVDIKDLTGSPGSNGIPDMLEEKLRDASGATTFDLTQHDPVTESAELLHFMLNEMAVFGVTPTGADSFTGAEVADTDGDGLLEFIDAWGNPLRFYRWPTRLIDIDLADTDPATPGRQGDVTSAAPGSGVEGEREFASLFIRGLAGTNGITRDPLLVDPDDTIGRIGFEILRLPNLDQAYNEAAFHSVDVYHTPLVVSAGSDGVTGLLEPNDVDVNAGRLGNLAMPADGDGDGVYGELEDISFLVDAASDNITNRNRRAGGSN